MFGVVRSDGVVPVHKLFKTVFGHLLGKLVSILPEGALCDPAKMVFIHSS